MNKFKVGDTVEFVNDRWVRQGGMGKVVKVDNVDVKMPYLVSSGGYKWWTYENDIMQISSLDEIRITVKGNKTIAVHKNGDQLIKRTEAICCPTDTFNFATGAKLAMDRLFEDKPKSKYDSLTDEKLFDEVCHKGLCSASNSSSRKNDCVFLGVEKNCAAIRANSTPEQRKDAIAYLIAEDTPEKPIEDKPKEVREVKREAKVGEYIKLTEEMFSFDKAGDVLKVNAVCNDYAETLPRDHPRRTGNSVTGHWSYPSENYVVLENYTPETEPKEEPRFEVGDKAKVIGNKLSGHHFPIGEIVRVIRKEGTNDYRTEYLDGRDWWSVNSADIEPYTEPEQKEPIKLYCVEDYSGGCHQLHKGETYEWHDSALFVHGEHHNTRWKTYEDWAKDNRNYSEHLVLLVSRPAKVGETILIIENGCHIPSLSIGDLHVVTRIDDDGDLHTGKRNVFSRSKQDEYLVLDGYQPKEPFKPYLEHDGKNYGVIGEPTDMTACGGIQLKVGDVVKVVNMRDGRMFSDVIVKSDKQPHLVEFPSTSLDVKNGEFNCYGARIIVCLDRDYTELVDGETIKGVTVHLTEGNTNG